jgi:hypothetical protein
MSVRGPNGEIFIFASSMYEGSVNRQEKSTLTTGQRGGTSFVREIYLANVNLHMFCKQPRISKSEHRMAKESGKKEQVLIASAPSSPLREGLSRRVSSRRFQVSLPSCARSGQGRAVQSSGDASRSH